VGLQACYIARVHQLHSSTEDLILNPLMMGKADVITWPGFFYAPLQSCPTGKSVLPRNHKLCVTQTKSRLEDFRIGAFRPSRMKFANSLRHGRIPRRMSLQQIFGLIFKVFETGIRRESSNWHDELPFLRPVSASLQAESQFVIEVVVEQGGLLSFPRTGRALLR